MNPENNLPSAGFPFGSNKTPAAPGKLKDGLRCEKSARNQKLIKVVADFEK